LINIQFKTIAKIKSMKKTILLSLLCFIGLYNLHAQTAYSGGYFPLNGFNVASINNYSIESCFGYSQYPCKNIGFTDEAGVTNGAIYVNNRQESTYFPGLYEYVNGFVGGILCSDQFCTYLNSFTIAFSFNLTNGGISYYTDQIPGGVVISSVIQNSFDNYSGYRISFGSYLTTDRRPTMQVNNFTLSTPNQVDTGVWYHVAFVFDQVGETSVYKIYLNNQLAAYSTSALNPIMQPFRPTSLFAQSYPNPNYNSSQPYNPLTNRPDLPYNAYRGALDELRIYNRALSDQEITDVYNARLSSPYPAITSFSPSSAAPGASITITGNNFSSASAVTINGQSASFTIVNGNTITATMPGSGRTTELSSNAVTAITGIVVTNSSGNAQLTGTVGTPPAPAPVLRINGSSTACGLSASDSALYVMSSEADASYNWSSSTSNIILSSGQGNDSLYVKFKSTFSTGTITCRRIVGTDTIIRSIAINKRIPSRPTSILGNKNVCAFVGTASGIQATYSVRAVQGATSYLWTLPDSVRVSGNPSAQVSTADTFINVVFRSTMAPDTIRVCAVNPCGSSTNALLAISVINPTFTSFVSGSTDACPSMISDSLPSGLEVTYRVRKTANISAYEWVVPANATIVARPGGAGTPNDTIIRVIFNASFSGGSIQVRGISPCFTTPYRSVYVYKRVPLSRSISSSLISSCPSRQYRYSISPIAYATRYEWSVPSNASIVGRSDTTFIIVNYSSSPSTVGDLVRVRGVNNCSVGNWSQLRISLPACTGTVLAFGKNTSAVDHNLQPQIIQNPTRSSFKISWPIQNQRGLVQVTDVTGRKLETIQSNGQSIQEFGSAYRPGTYFVLIQYGEQVIRFKLIKE
jgi:hypothetical protein